MSETAPAPAPARSRTDHDGVTVVVDDVHVTYRVYEDRKPTLKGLARQRFQGRRYREVKAVRGVSLTTRAGEAIGLIGRNGSGKSTLLLTIAGLIPTTSGAVYAHTEPTLLGVGAALQRDLSGRRNVYLGGLAMGMTRRYIDQHFDEIVDFAGVGDFIDMPLRTYSSGMAARLHFAVASAVMPEVLLIDEALAVGDEDFKGRSEARIRELRRHAGTVFLVSHNLENILETCTRVLWLDKGTVQAEGDPAEVVGAYRKAVKDSRR